MSWFSRFANVFRPSRVDGALDEEIAFHLEARVDELTAAGMPRHAAEAMARRQFGNRLRLREASREVKVIQWMDDLGRDLRYGMRALRRMPLFASVAILTLALGIGANTAILSIVNGVLLRPLPYPQPAQLMYLATSGGQNEFPVSVPEYLEFQQFTRSFADVGAFRLGEVNLLGGDRALRVRSASVDAHLLAALGVRTSQGRLFTSGDSLVQGTLPGGIAITAPVVVVSYELWRSALGARPIVGQLIEVDGRRLEVVGVLQPGVDLMDTRTDVWLPLGFTADERLARNNHNLTLIGRLRADVSPPLAQRELTALTETWRSRTGLSPGAGHEGHVFVPAGVPGGGHRLQMTPLDERMLGRANLAIWILQGAVGLLLLIACANVANLLLSRAEARQHEFAVLSALGAGTGRLVRKVLTESVALSVAGGTIGIVLANVGVEALVRRYPASLPRIGGVSIDLSVIAVSIVMALMCGLVFGLAPMLHWRRHETADRLKSSPRTSSGATHHRVRSGLVVLETALAVMVVAGAGLLWRTVHNLTAVDTGFDRSRVVTFSITLPQPRYDLVRRARTFQRLLDGVRAVPGIDSASAMSSVPLDRPFRINQSEISNNTTGAPTVGLDYQRVMSNFFETTRIPIVQGRAFDAVDAASPGSVAIVNETFARTYWKGLDPIGQRLRPGGTMPWFTAIGVARDVRQTGVDEDVRPEAYVFVDQLATPTLTSFLSVTPATMHVVLRTALPPAALASTVARIVGEVDPAVPVARLREMDDVFADSIRRPRLLADLLALFSALALILAAIGTYGVLASTVAERRREIGIRLALGANRLRLLRQVMMQGLVLATVGLVAGLAAALGLNRLLSSLLFGVRPADLLNLAIVMASIIGVAAVASWFPAWRASRLDPTVVLRMD